LRVVKPAKRGDLAAAEQAAAAFLVAGCGRAPLTRWPAPGVDLDTESLAATSVTSALHGRLRSDATSRAEFITLIGANQQEMMHHG
jgi:hypothetical protein